MVLYTPYPAEEIEGPIRSSMGRVREGIHVSSLIDYIERGLGMKPDTPNPSGHLYAIMGIAWEDYLRKQLGEVDFIWGLEVEVDGIIGTLDAFHLPSSRPLECKATWASCSKEIIDVWRYMVQVKAYCKMTNTASAIMYVFYLCGDWKPPVPILKKYELEFTEREIDENWVMLLNSVEGYRKESNCE